MLSFWNLSIDRAHEDMVMHREGVAVSTNLHGLSSEFTRCHYNRLRSIPFDQTTSSFPDLTLQKESLVYGIMNG